MSRPADRGSVIRSDNCHAGLVIYHLEEIIIEHIEKRIIFSCSNEGEYSGYKSGAYLPFDRRQILAY